MDLVDVTQLALVEGILSSRSPTYMDGSIS